MTTQTVTKLYDSYRDAKAAVAALESAGVPHSAITLLASQSSAEADEDHTAKDAGIGATAGAILGGGAGLLAGLGIIAIPGIGPVVAAGWLVAALAGLAFGASGGAAVGGFIGALTEHGISEEEAHIYAESLKRGGALVAVKAVDELLPTIHGVFNDHPSVDPAVRAAAYRSAGWSAFDRS